MNKMNIIKKLITLFLLALITTSVNAKWNNLDQPYDGLSIKIGDKKVILNNVVIFWVKFDSTDNLHTMLTQSAVDCNTYEYKSLFIEEDKVVQNIKYSEKSKISKDGDMMFYPIQAVCKDVSLFCKASDTKEDLLRTPENESWSILKDEITSSLIDNLNEVELY